MSPAAKALYNRLVAEKINNEDFRIELLEYYYNKNFAIKKINLITIHLGEIPEDIKHLSAYVMDEDFKLVIEEYKRVFHLSGWIVTTNNSFVWSQTNNNSK